MHPSPGEVLPKLPLATHFETGKDGLKLFKFINQTLSEIPDYAPNHNIEYCVFKDGRSEKPYDGDTILPRTMTTSGRQNYHPDGKQDFTSREDTCLQGFPPNPVFRGNAIKKQIGNAVPPCVARILFESVGIDLVEADEIVEEPLIMLSE
jgi:DNA (cytosine-5)-methyltransferase 1